MNNIQWERPLVSDLFSCLRLFVVFHDAFANNFHTLLRLVNYFDHNNFSSFVTRGKSKEKIYNWPDGKFYSTAAMTEIELITMCVRFVVFIIDRRP